MCSVVAMQHHKNFGRPTTPPPRRPPFPEVGLLPIIGAVVPSDDKPSLTCSEMGPPFPGRMDHRGRIDRAHRQVVSLRGNWNILPRSYVRSGLQLAACRFRVSPFCWFKRNTRLVQARGPLLHPVKAWALRLRSGRAPRTSRRRPHASDATFVHSQPTVHRMA